jgi:hypothetical protein
MSYVFSSTELGKREEQVLPGSEGGGRKKEWAEGRGRNDLNNVCTYEYMNRGKKNPLCS